MKQVKCKEKWTREDVDVEPKTCRMSSQRQADPTTKGKKWDGKCSKGSLYVSRERKKNV
jgi:hypothetical protein